MFKKRKKSKAFSLIEVLMSAFILGVGLVAAIGLLSSGLRQSIENRSQLTATFLSQEGVELVRNIRDNNWANSRPSFDGINDADNCRIDVTEINLDHCGGDYLLSRSSSDGYYRYDVSGEKSRFSRKITISGSASQKIVTSYVIWGQTFPSGTGTCNTRNKCAYTQIALNKWKE